MITNRYIKETLQVAIFVAVACLFSLLNNYQTLVIPNIELPFYHLPVLYAAYRLSFRKAIFIAILKAAIMWFVDYGFKLDSMIFISLADVFAISLILIIMVPNFSTSMYSTAAFMAVAGITGQFVLLGVLSNTYQVFISSYANSLFIGLMVSVCTMIITKVFDEKIIKREIVWNAHEMEMANFDEN